MISITKFVLKFYQPVCFYLVLTESFMFSVRSSNEFFFIVTQILMHFIDLEII